MVEKTIADLGAGGKPSMIVFNKVDAYTYVEKAEDDLTPKTKENITLEELMHTWMAKLMIIVSLFPHVRRPTLISSVIYYIKGKGTACAEVSLQ